MPDVERFGVQLDRQGRFADQIADAWLPQMHHAQR